MTIISTGAYDFPAAADRNRNSMMLGLGVDSDPLAVIDGVHSGLTITKTTGMGFQIGPGRAAVNGASSSDGTFTCAVTAPEVGAFEPGHDTMDRIDLVVLQTYPENPATTGVKVEVVKGVPAASPVAPQDPTGALVLYQIRIPAGMSAANGGWSWPGYGWDRRRSIGIPEFVEYTPTWVGFDNLGTGALREARYRVDGDKVSLHFHVKAGAGGSMGLGHLSFTPPIVPAAGYRYYGSGSLHWPDNNGNKYDLRVYTNGNAVYLWGTQPNGQMAAPGVMGYPFSGGTEIYGTLEYVIDLP